MAKTRLFVSFDYSHDLLNKGHFISQSEETTSPFAVVDVSLDEEVSDSEWVSKAQRAISECDVFMVLLGPNTHSAPGVARELSIARGLKKPRFQLRPQGRNHHALEDGGEVCVWKWKSIDRMLNRLRSQGLLKA